MKTGSVVGVTCLLLGMRVAQLQVETFGSTWWLLEAVRWGTIVAGIFWVYQRTAALKTRLDAIRGEEHLYDRTELDAHGRRADTMIAAGAIGGSLLLALGIGLIAAGAHDRRDYRRLRRVAAVRLTPTLGGLTLTGRF